MAVFYVGPRPVTRGRNANDSVHPIKGVGEYSNYDLWNSSHVLDGAPNEHHVPGTGYHVGDIFLSSLMAGNAVGLKMPLESPGGGAELSWYTLSSVLQARAGQDGQGAFGTNFGHELRASDYSFGYTTHATDTTEYLTDSGHADRGIDETGTANSFGRSRPYIFKGLAEVFTDYGQGVPEGYDNDYGHNKPLEWRGVASARALQTGS